jgi:formate dehydrogenase subunit gamma
MAKLTSRIRTVAGALVLTMLLMIAAAVPPPASAQQINPTTSALKEQQLLNQLKPGGAISGRITIPDQKAANLIHPAGRDWREFRTETLKWVGAVAILGMIVVLAIFYLWRGRIPIEEGRSGRAVLRFNWFERFVHWLTATAFVVLGITGLNVTFGRILFAGGGGSEAFSTWSQWAKYAHNYVSFAFTLGVVLMFLMWISQNFPTAADVEWLKRGGGMFTKKHGDHPPAWKFNAGQKLLYWFVVLGGIAMIVTGYMLMFPFYGGLTLDTMELSQIFHGIVGVLFVAMIIAHIYLGTLGMEGAFEAMAEGTVDYNWAKEHHPLWVEEEMRRHPGGVSGARPSATPAE